MADFAYRPGTNPNPPPSSSAAGGGPAPSAGSGGPVSPTGRAFAQRFPVYQIDFTSVASGKKLASTKRRIRWYVHNVYYNCVSLRHISCVMDGHDNKYDSTRPIYTYQ